MKDNNMESDTTTISDVGTLDIVIKDPKNLPVENLEFQVIVNKNIVGSGKTDSKGNAKTIEGLKIGNIFEIHVKTDKGEFKKVATGTINSTECISCLQSTSTRFEFSSYIDYGKPGKAETHKEKVIENSGHTTETKTNTVDKHNIKDDRDTKGKPVKIVENGAKIYPAAASKIIAALPLVDKKKYMQGVPSKLILKTDPTSSNIPDQLVCNEYVYFAFGRAGEKIPYNMNEQIKYFKDQNRFVADMTKGEVGDVAFFGSPPHHEVIVTDVIVKVGIKADTKWYTFSGAKSTGKVSGALTSGQTKNHKEEPIYIRQDGQPASFRDGDLLLWGDSSTSVVGFTSFVGFGKAGR